MLTTVSAQILQDMAQEGRKSKLSQSERKELREAMLADTPELTFTPRGDPDPRLIQLARMLGRQLARQNLTEQGTKRNPHSPR
ncbi:hypothetical protein [Agrobacterium tumefaciens]|uniref:hypothetical protein n=1 Tax=Agrobacterium tumefaciens TaxID=358 RepID=UPI001F290C5C|nr:hypothetical protein [Agrobacterium tumefaciens]